MKFSNAKEFLNMEYKAITLIGMSGIGKSFYSTLLEQYGWYAYSADVRIGSHYLGELMLDDVRGAAADVPYLRDLLKSKAIDFRNQININNLELLAKFIGKVGNPEQGGRSLDEFMYRQDLYRDAEIKSMIEIPAFMNRAQEFYGRQNFINDTAGSLCELDSAEMIKILNDNTVIIYIRATKEDEQELINRAIQYPKPLLYNKTFFFEVLKDYMGEKDISEVRDIDPDDFSRAIFPRLFYSRLPKYETMAARYGYTVSVNDMRGINTEQDFLELIAEAIDNDPGTPEKIYDTKDIKANTGLD